MTQQIQQLRAQAERVRVSLGADAYIVYVTSIREPVGIFGGQVHPDILITMSDQLRELGKKRKLVLLLQTNGGDLSAPWPIVSLLREFCNELNTVVVNRALSAGTLISIGSDKIIMGPDAFLSPVDPQAQISINGQMKKVEVEDVTGYIEFVKNRAGLSGGLGLEKAFESLTSEIPPTVIGSLYRTHALIRSLASKILNTRNKKFDTATEKHVIENLTEKLFSHSHLISRQEAKTQVGLGASIVIATDGQLVEVDKFSELVKKQFNTQAHFNPDTLLGDAPTYEEEIFNAILLTSAQASVYKSTVQIARTPDGKTAVKVNNKGWVKE